ncbi:MAG TPA: transcription termination/antitermination NusG family protein [Terracidiphilus sp.]|nr:transcription termination/antitermination NusG family protein [Terracidiphilus sp.]
MKQGSWQVLQVRSNFEKRVAKHLAVRAVEHYLPLYRERVRWTDRTVIAERPLFSGYVFARYLRETRVTVLSIPGLVRSLGDDDPNLINSSEIDRIRIGLSTGLLIRPHPHISVGTRVRVRNGVFEGVEGLVTELRQQSKVILALTQLQRCFSLEIEAGDIEVLKPAIMKKPAVSIDRGWAVFGAHVGAMAVDRERRTCLESAKN